MTLDRVELRAALARLDDAVLKLADLAEALPAVLQQLDAALTVVNDVANPPGPATVLDLDAARARKRATP